MSIETLITTHNELATMLDRDTITRWKKTEPALRTLNSSMKKELAAMRAAKQNTATETPVETPVETPKATTDWPLKPAKKATKAKKTTKPAPKKAPVKKATKKVTKPAPKKATTPKAATNTTTVVEIAAKLNINPKVARAKLRRRGMTSADGRWNAVKVDSKDHKKMIEILKNGRKAD